MIVGSVLHCLILRPSQLSKVILSSEAQLSNESFLSKAPEKVLSTMREKLADYKAQLAKSQEALHEL